MFRFFKKKDLSLLLRKNADSMTALSNAHDRLINKPRHDEEESDFIASLAIKLMLNRVLDESVEIIKKNSGIRKSDDAIDKLIELFPNSFDFFSISTKFNVDYEIDTCMRIYSMRHGNDAENHIKDELQSMIEIIEKQCIVQPHNK